jgi:hypothetical protein
LTLALRPKNTNAQCSISRESKTGPTDPINQYTKAKSALDGVQTAFWLWLGFIVTTQLATVVFEERKLGLYLLNIGYQFFGCAIAGLILAVWKTREAKEAAAQPA